MIPNYQLQLGNISLDPSQGDEVEELNAQLSMDAPADSLSTYLRQSTKLSGLKNGDPSSVSLGYNSNVSPVFSGIIDMMEVGISHTRVLGLSQMVKLLRLRLNQTYLNQTAGAIVRDLCNRSQVPVGDVQDGITLPSFFMSHEAPAYEYMRGLAERSGFDLYYNPENKLVFKEYTPNEIHDFEYGVNVLQVESAQISPPEAVKVYGESPSSIRGSDTAHWLTKDSVEGAAGTGQALLYFDPAVRDKATADSVAKSRLAKAKHTLHLSMLTLGNPAVKLGEAVSLKRFDHDLLKGEFKVRSIEHSLNKRSGFTTRIFCSKEV